MRRIAAASLRYLDVGATVPPDANPSVDLVEFAFIPTDDDPVSGDWMTGTWFTTATRLVARILIGPGGVVTLTPNVYRVWVRVSATPERVVAEAGRMQVY
jgi:hypothetical protein